MVRGNWQKRVETAEARRKEAKQRKQRSDDRRLHKGWVMDCWALLDRHGRRPLRVHIWTDTLASDGPPLLDIVDFIGDGVGAGSTVSKRRSRSGSLSEGNQPDVGSPTGKKKVHPRSSAAAAATSDDPGRDVTPLLCKSHFFFGKCEDAGSFSSRRKSSAGCRFVHYSSRYQSLASALHNTKCTVASGADSDTRQRNVELSERAAGGGAPDKNNGDGGGLPAEAMDMVYYACIELKQSEESATPLSEEISDALVGMNISASSVVYVVINNSLIFDRCREGVLVTDREFLFILTGQNPELVGGRRASVESQGDEAESNLETTLPGSILEHILTFLPDAAVASASRVCKAWHHEIGQNSPDLWKHMLERHGWPIPKPTSQEDERDASRAAFLQHYTAVRDLRAIKKGISAILTKAHAAEVEMSYQDFSTRKNAPSQVASFACVSVQVWSPRHILTAYARDCTLRLFESVPRGGGGGVAGAGEGLMCREIVCRKVDPYRNTKRRHCSILDVGLDDETIGCLCRVMADSVDVEAHVLVVLSRDDFLVGDGDYTASGHDKSLRVIDIGEAVLNFLLSSDVADHQLLQVMDFLSANEGEIGDVEILASGSVAACGYGRFMIEVSLSIPDVDQPDGDGEGNWSMRLIYRQLVLFSATIGAIVWMGDSNGDLPLLPRHLDMTLSTLHSVPVPGGSRTHCCVLSSSPLSPALVVASIEPSGSVECSRLVASHEIPDAEGWDVVPQTTPVVALVSTNAIVVEVLRKTEDGRIVDRKSVVRFCRRFPTDDEPSCYHLSVTGGVEAEQLVNFGTDHVLLLGHEYIPVPAGRAPADRTDNGTTPSYRIAGVAVLLHIPSRREVHRLRLIDSMDEDGSLPEIETCPTGGTIGVALSCKGVVMTGSAIRAIAEPRVVVLDDLATGPNRSAAASKKKKKKLVPKNNKKDGFARGMSLRG